MDLLDMKLFLLVAETKSISQSAEILHFSQSTISHRLKNLENELGVSLFTRSKGNRAELTPHGESFIPVAKRWQAVWEDTQTIRDLPSEALTVAAIESVNASILPPIYRSTPSPLQVDWLDVPPELYRKCYMIRHKVPKSSSGAAKNRFAELVRKSIEANERP